MATYPAHRENDVVLRDGSTVHVRPARPDDAPVMEQLLEGLSDRSRRLRFFFLLGRRESAEPAD